MLDQFVLHVYINDIDFTLDELIQTFADDQKLYGRLKAGELVLSKQSSLESVYIWEKVWQMLINQGKCKVLCVGTNSSMHYYILFEKHCYRSKHSRNC